MLPLALIIWSTVALLAAIGLHALTPRHIPGQHLLPAIRTITLITTAAAYVAAVWSH
jgi:hypothetical protein